MKRACAIVAGDTVTWKMKNCCKNTSINVKFIPVF
jgi:hypothetical protein